MCHSQVHNLALTVLYAPYSLKKTWSVHRRHRVPPHSADTRHYHTGRIYQLVLESQLPHEIVNLLFAITNQNNKLTIF